MSRSTLMNSRVPDEPRSASRRRRNNAKRCRQLPMPRAGGRSRARLVFARGVPGSDGGHRWCALFPSDGGGWRRALGPARDRDLLDPARSRSPRDGRRRSAPSSRCGQSARGRTSSPAEPRRVVGSKDTVRQAEHRVEVLLQALGLGCPVAPGAPVEIGDTTLLEVRVQLREGCKATARGRGSSAVHSRRGSRRGPSRCPERRDKSDG